MFPPVFVKGSDNSSDSSQTFMRVRKKPIIVEALQMDSEFQVQTMEGTMKGKPGDYLMRGVKGELYICDRQIFEQTYDIIE